MSFVETPRFPQYIAYEAIGGAEYNTQIVELDSGGEQRNIAWDQPRARFQVTMPLEEPKKNELIAWFHAMKGRANGFRLRDWNDNTATAVPVTAPSGVTTQGRLGTSPNGTGAAVYQLTKAYTVGSLTSYRNIRKPAYLQPIQLLRGGVLQTAGSNYTLDTTTGLVTFIGTPPSTSEALAHDCSYDLPVRFDTDYQGLTKISPGVWDWQGLQLIELRT